MDANAAEFLDFLIGCSPEPRLSLYKNGLDELNRGAHQQTGKPFAELSSSEAEPLLDSLRELWQYERAGKTDLAGFLLAVKGNLLRATFNSRVYIDAVSQERRPRNASNFYWYPIS